VNLIRLLGHAPLSGTAVLLCLTTIGWCIRVVRKRQKGTDRFLLALLGLVAISEGLRILREVGAWTTTDLFRRLDDVANFSTAALYLVAVLLMELSSRNRITAEVGLRLLQGTANPLGFAGPPEERPLIILASDGCVAECNAAAARTLGWQQKHVIGRRFTLEDPKTVDAKECVQSVTAAVASLPSASQS
jgi:PAS domain-containing protein